MEGADGGRKYDGTNSVPVAGAIQQKHSKITGAIIQANSIGRFFLVSYPSKYTR